MSRSLSARERGPIRVGTDLCSVRDVEASVEAFGDRYLRRVYTEHELEYCGRDPQRSAERLAARFAAKEAVVKVLRPREARPEWKSIEVRRDPDGWCELSLTGTAARLAREQAIDSLAVSLSHEAGLANAVVVATLTGGHDSEHETEERRAGRGSTNQ